jgi:hypothetical protein
MVVRFDRREEDAEQRLARYVAELVKAAVTFRIRQDQWEYEVELTGGF